LSLVTFATGWLGESHFSQIPAALYGMVLFMAAVAYWILQNQIICSQGRESILKQAVGNDWKGKLSPIIYISAIAVSFLTSKLSLALYVLVALVWLIPDKRIEKLLKDKEDV
jgi:uncharacterized membrane protein